MESNKEVGPQDPFAASLRAARAYAELDQGTVAERLEVSRQLYSRWERGLSKPTTLIQDAVIGRMVELTGLPEMFFRQGPVATTEKAAA